MKPATTFSSLSPKSSLSAVALATALFLPAAPAWAYVPTWDGTNFGQNIVTAAQTTITAAQTTITAAQSTLTAAQTAIANELAIAKQVWDESEVVRKAKSGYDAYKSMQAAQSLLADKLSDLKTSVTGDGDPVQYDMAKINGLSNSSKTTLSAPAAALFKDAEKTCKVGKSLKEGVTPLALDGLAAKAAALFVGPMLVTLEDQLGANCIAQRELKAMEKQLTYDYEKKINALMAHQKSFTTASPGIDGGEVNAMVATLNTTANVQLVQNLEKEKYEALKSAMNVEMAVLTMRQRELEVMALQGQRDSAAGSFVNTTIKNALIATAVGGVAATMAVNGNRKTTLGAKYGYAD